MSINYNVLAMIDPGAEITIRTTETLRTTGPYLLSLHDQGLIELELPNSLRKGPQLTKKVTFETRLGFPINQFIQKMSPIIRELTVSMKARAMPAADSMPQAPLNASLKESASA